MTSSSLRDPATELLTDAQRIELLRGLVAIPSTSRNEADAVAYLCRWMTGLGFQAGPDEAGSALTEDHVTAFAKERMANFKVPRRVAFVDALPMTATGKVVKDELRAIAAKEAAP